ncbi:MAG TPA: YibE/F family protein [Candidatus Flavonifractor merdipullorum]|uniref:YibE/F family protein n=1 Tax=Candidatus Flavonifractor merdipullorum TaxID=2838590 RepID=A0A9D1RWP6_9FIRM|nr:YibE/F family protein [Candidatus Flavonifractor merdipullorum]
MNAILRDPVQRRYYAPVALCLVLILLILFLPTGYEDAVQYQEADRCAARVLAVDDSAIIDTGLVRSGEQTCTLELLGGRFKGQTATGVNMLNGSLEQDKIFAPGDKAMVVVSYTGDEILSVTMIDHYRINKEVLLAGIFAVFLVLFAGRTGVRAILSFVLTILMLWKVLVPLYLKGVDPILIGLAVTLILTLLIIALVYGFDRRCASAVSGAFLGVLVTCVLGILFTDLFQIHGAVMSYSESLLYSGYQDLNLTKIFMAAIFIGSSGAVMDLAVDITSAVNEVVEKRPDISRWEAVRSGINVGRAAMGTMTTTLLLAYSGGYVALLMVFMAQGTPIYNILNYKYVASELIHTIVGSFGLVTVAPLTALTSGFLLVGRHQPAAAVKE